MGRIVGLVFDADTGELTEADIVELTEADIVELTDLTKAELKERLDSAGVEYDERMNKDELIALLQE